MFFARCYSIQVLPSELVAAGYASAIQAAIWQPLEQKSRHRLALSSMALFSGYHRKSATSG